MPTRDLPVANLTTGVPALPPDAKRLPFKNKLIGVAPAVGFSIMFNRSVKAGDSYAVATARAINDEFLQTDCIYSVMEYYGNGYQGVVNEKKQIGYDRLEVDNEYFPPIPTNNLIKGPGTRK